MKRFRVTGTGYEISEYHFEKLITTPEAKTRYNAGVVELQAPTLKQLLVTIRTANQEVINGSANVNQLRMQRNQLLYGAEGSVYKTAGA